MENQYSELGDVTFCDSRLVGRHGTGVHDSMWDYRSEHQKRLVLMEGADSARAGILNRKYLCHFCAVSNINMCVRTA